MRRADNRQTDGEGNGGGDSACWKSGQRRVMFLFVVDTSCVEPQTDSGGSIGEESACWKSGHKRIFVVESNALRIRNRRMWVLLCVELITDGQRRQQWQPRNCISQGRLSQRRDELCGTSRLIRRLDNRREGEVNSGDPGMLDVRGDRTRRGDRLRTFVEPLGSEWKPSKETEKRRGLWTPSSGGE